MSKPELNSTHITFLTLASAFVGLIAVYCYPFALLLVPILLAPKYIYASAVHSWTTVAPLTLTTFAFGIINAFCLIDILAFLTTDMQAVPEFGSTRLSTSVLRLLAPTVCFNSFNIISFNSKSPVSLFQLGIDFNSRFHCEQWYGQSVCSGRS